VKQSQHRAGSAHAEGHSRATAGSPADISGPCTAARAFEVLWATLADVLGHTATAALLQRSIKRAAADVPELTSVAITREQFAYQYTLPDSWTHADATGPAAVQPIVRALWPLLAELTGSVVIERLRQNPVLRTCGVIPKDVDL
jgi:hypothetical protein